mmetsp:Transcript_67613/g.209185  ORF Transcript_67613/g.209185 Transcript_67613/m.209185 type:complete len:82 (-) Transcript_67613:89-334(-)
MREMLRLVLEVMRMRFGDGRVHDGFMQECVMEDLLEHRRVCVALRGRLLAEDGGCSPRPAQARPSGRVVDVQGVRGSACHC